jgi:thymidylate synthase (FAD)
MILRNPKIEIEQITPTKKAYELLERIGRVCYKSEDMITDYSANSFIQKLVKRNHLSVIEHCIVTIRFITNRGVTDELLRHRLASFTQESTRFCNYANRDHIEFIIPHWIDMKDCVYTYDDLPPRLLDSKDIFLYGLLNAEHTYFDLIESGKKPEDARDILPLDIKTELVMTANLREWLLVCKLRAEKPAHPNMIQIMSTVLKRLRKEYPEIFNYEKEK